MLEVKINETAGIAILYPGDALTQADFEHAARRIDAFLKAAGAIRGVIINTRHFPGWKSFNAMLNHFRFIRDHHERIPRVALVTDSPVGQVGEKVADHFVDAEIRHFDFDDLEGAERWLTAE